MEILENRKWMDNRLDRDQNIREEFKQGCLGFVNFVLEKYKDNDKENIESEENIQNMEIRCPCKKCKCLRHHPPSMVMVHLCRKGFMSDYYHWTYHGEPIPPIPPMVVNHSYYGSSGNRDMFDNYEQLVMDAAGPAIGNYLEREGHNEEDIMVEDPNLEAQQFFELLKVAQSPLWDGCDRHSVLSASLAALSLKADYRLSEGCFNGLVQLMGDTMPDDNKMPKNFYQAKKSLAELGLASMKIECCPNGCMLYYKEDEMLQNCKHCEEQRYRHVTRRGKLKLIPLKSMWYFPLVPRLQRLYSSVQTAREMRWHRENQREAGSLSHPSDAEAWKHFDEAWPTFSHPPSPPPTNEDGQQNDNEYYDELDG